jgi:hypothetical protein
MLLVFEKMNGPKQAKRGFGHKICPIFMIDKKAKGNCKKPLA